MKGREVGADRPIVESTWPRGGSSSPVSMRVVVVLPEPFGPR